MQRMLVQGDANAAIGVRTGSRAQGIPPEIPQGGGVPPVPVELAVGEARQLA